MKIVAGYVYGGLLREGFEFVDLQQPAPRWRESSRQRTGSGLRRIEG